MMRYGHAILAMLLWAVIMNCSLAEKVSTDTQLLSLTVMIAGALAGGD